ncbi:hypothetical protein QEZ54_31995 [Catellatospora sp. KI3]|uniref:hypothetical protein n=1 Tax=Catellatospora sp. KI3 TaxID=3041620 RepID=UPI00248319C3|nr:hypothetical protein [Catellatospora sp. KI3]MDI1465602.1 hypothetical protein [Catellatospora sp. KI3]
MQVGKAGIVAAGAMATVAVFGTAASAAPQAGPAGVDPIQTAATALKQTALQRASVAAAAADQVARGPQRQDRPQPLISIGNGSSVMALALQSCGSTSATAGVAASVNSPNTVLGDCGNANVLIRQSQVRGVISILDNTSINAVPVQVCGSNAAVAGATLSLTSPATVVGSCYNANTLIAAPKDGEGGEDDAPQSLVAIGSGSVVNALATQVCGSTAGILGAPVAVQSPTTVLGDCYNSNSTIQRTKSPALLPLLTNQVIDLVPLQVCASSGLIGQLGPALPINSPAFVAGQCASGQQNIID